jgi:hypothetical protein
MAADLDKAVARVIVGNVAVDATIDEVHTYSSSITDYLVETGSTLSSNRRKNPDKLRLTVLITDHPIDEPASHADGVVMGPKSIKYHQKKDLSVGAYGYTLSAPGPLNLVTSEQEEKELSATGPSAQLTRVQAVYDEFQRMHEDGDIFDVITAYRVFPSMAIESLSAPRTNEAAIEFTLDLKAIRYATARRTALVFSKLPAAHKKVSKGKQTPVVVTDEKRKSFLARVVDAGKGLMGGT